MRKIDIFVIVCTGLMASACVTLNEALSELDNFQLPQPGGAGTAGSQSFTIFDITAGEEYASVVRKFPVKTKNSNSTTSVKTLKELNSFSGKFEFKFTSSDRKLCTMSYTIRERNQNSEEFEKLVRQLVAKHNSLLGPHGAKEHSMSRTYTWHSDQSNGVYRADINWYPNATYISSKRIAPYVTVDYKFYNFRDCL